MGQGPMTGRRMGRCTNFGQGKQIDQRENTILPENQSPNQERRGFGADLENRFGSGRGLGRGFGRRFRGGR